MNKYILTSYSFLQHLSLQIPCHMAIYSLKSSNFTPEYEIMDKSLFDLHILHVVSWDIATKSIDNDLEWCLSL